MTSFSKKNASALLQQDDPDEACRDFFSRFSVS